MDTHNGKDRALDCDYVWHPVPIDKIPDFLLDGHSFIIVGGPCVFIRVSAGQVLQIGRDKDAVPCTIVLTTKREVPICNFKFLLMANMLGSCVQVSQ